MASSGFANQLNTSEDASGVATFTYDANGNTETQEVPNGDLTTYTWDIENHLTKVELPSNVINTITLDGDGKRRSIEDSAGLRNILWDMENILAETDSGGSTVAQYTLAPEAYGELISQRRSGATSFHHFDVLGSTNKLTDSSENGLIEYLYKAFGEQSILSGSSANPFTWVGKLGYYREMDLEDYWIEAALFSPKEAKWLPRIAPLWSLPPDDDCHDEVDWKEKDTCNFNPSHWAFTTACRPYIRTPRVHEPIPIARVWLNMTVLFKHSNFLLSKCNQALSEGISFVESNESNLTRQPKSLLRRKTEAVDDWDTWYWHNLIGGYTSYARGKASKQSRGECNGGRTLFTFTFVWKLEDQTHPVPLIMPFTYWLDSKRTLTIRWWKGSPPKRTCYGRRPGRPRRPRAPSSGMG